VIFTQPILPAPVLSPFLDFLTAIGPAFTFVAILPGDWLPTSQTDIQDNRQSAIFSATFGDTELFPFAVDCTRAMNLSLDNLQSTALSLGGLAAFLRRYVDRLSRHTRDAHLQLTASRIL
jgi:hypothetical protein